MAKRGRKSTAELAIKPSPDVLETVARPDVPYCLDDHEAATWRRVVAALPADWFGPEAFDVLSQFCRHMKTADRLRQLIRQAEGADDGLDLPTLLRLYRAESANSQTIATLATKLRICPQSTRTDRGNKRKSGGAKPWEWAR